jgi:hypothetical protein
MITSPLGARAQETYRRLGGVARHRLTAPSHPSPPPDAGRIPTRLSIAGSDRRRRRDPGRPGPPRAHAYGTTAITCHHGAEHGRGDGGRGGCRLAMTNAQVRASTTSRRREGRDARKRGQRARRGRGSNRWRRARRSWSIKDVAESGARGCSTRTPRALVELSRPRHGRHAQPPRGACSPRRRAGGRGVARAVHALGPEPPGHRRSPRAGDRRPSTASGSSWRTAPRRRRPRLGLHALHLCGAPGAGRRPEAAARGQAGRVGGAAARVGAPSGGRRAGGSGLERPRASVARGRSRLGGRGPRPADTERRRVGGQPRACHNRRSP